MVIAIKQVLMARSRLLQHIFNRSLPAWVAALAMAGCASVPDTISTPVEGPYVSEARSDPQAHTGARVRWGGTISDVRNLEDRTVLTVVARPITRRGEPIEGNTSTGRFLAEVDRFLDPAVYEEGRRVTAVGRFTEIRSLPIDEYIYDYPVVRAGDLYLWEDYVRSTPRYPAPYYHRYGHRYHYPFWHFPHHGFHRYPGW